MAAKNMTLTVRYSRLRKALMPIYYAALVMVGVRPDEACGRAIAFAVRGARIVGKRAE